jgi:hypothetical protein
MTATLLGEWGFLDNLNDTSGNSHNASANFTPAYTTGPQTDTRAVILNNAAYTITYGRTGLEPTSASGGIVSMLWAKTNSYCTGYSALMNKMRAYDSTRHTMSVHNEAMFRMARWKSRLAYADEADVFLDNAWHHVCLIDSDDRYAVFVDGTSIVDVANDQSGNSLAAWEDYPWISGHNPQDSGPSTDTNLYLSGVRLFSGTMSDSDVATWMNTAIVPPSGRSGKPKVWGGSSFDSHPAKVWDGSTWTERSMSGYDGADWVVAK